jgi:hypothetical protein
VRDPRLELARIEHSIRWLERHARTREEHAQLVALLERKVELERDVEKERNYYEPQTAA